MPSRSEASLASMTPEAALASMTPEAALQILREGNERFRLGRQAKRDSRRQIEETRDGQWPIAAILSCMDSRTSAELIFDLALGDAFGIRLAGNCVNQDVIGSLEYAGGVVGSRIVVVLGHSGCGAVKGACEGVELGSLTALLRRIEPAIEMTRRESLDRAGSDQAFLQRVAVNNVHLGVAEIRRRSPTLRALEDQGAIAIVGAMYDIADGTVEFLTRRPRGRSR